MGPQTTSFNAFGEQEVSLSIFIERRKDTRRPERKEDEDTEAAIVERHHSKPSCANRRRMERGVEKQTSTSSKQAREKKFPQNLRPLSKNALSIIANDFADFVFPVSSSTPSNITSRNGLVSSNTGSFEATTQDSKHLEDSVEPEVPWSRMDSEPCSGWAASNGWSKPLFQKMAEVDERVNIPTSKHGRRKTVDRRLKPSILPRPRIRNLTGIAPFSKSARILSGSSLHATERKRFNAPGASYSSLSTATTCCSSTDSASTQGPSVATTGVLSC